MPQPRSDTTRIVIDNGGHTCKVGLAGQPEPARLMPMPSPPAPANISEWQYFRTQLIGASQFALALASLSGAIESPAVPVLHFNGPIGARCIRRCGIAVRCTIYRA